MDSITLALTAFACIFGGALLGLGISFNLPHHHLSENGRDIVKLGAGLLATLVAMVLGLLVSSAKGTLDSINTELTQAGARVIMLDRVLAKYGPETREVRRLLSGSVAGVIERVWPEEKTRHVRVGTIESTTGLDTIQDKLRELKPTSDIQRQLQSQALQIVNNLVQSRWIIIEQTQLTLPTAFLVVLLTWLTMLFACFGLLSPGKNSTVIAILFICAVSVSGAIFLINEMNTPLTGIIKVSSAPLHKALEHLGR